MSRIALVPGCLGLLPEYASLTDPFDDLRAACSHAVAWLGDQVEVVATDQGRRVAEALLAHRPRAVGEVGSSHLVVANGSACRNRRDPGYLGHRAVDFDDAVSKALALPDVERLRNVDQDLARELLASTEAFPALAELLTTVRLESVDYDDDPYGVQYWVMRWVGTDPPTAPGP